MNKNFLLAGSALVSLTIADPDVSANSSPAWRFHADHVLGTSLDVTAVAADESTAKMAAEAVRAEIDRLDRVLSGWREDSELDTRNNHLVEARN